MSAPVSKASWFTLFEIQGPDRKKYASPYIEGHNITDATKNIFSFLNERHIVFVVKEGPSLALLTTSPTMPYADFFRAYTH